MNKTMTVAERRLWEQRLSDADFVQNDHLYNIAWDELDKRRKAILARRAASGRHAAVVPVMRDILNSLFPAPARPAARGDAVADRETA